MVIETQYWDRKYTMCILSLGGGNEIENLRAMQGETMFQKEIIFHHINQKFNLIEAKSFILKSNIQ